MWRAELETDSASAMGGYFSALAEPDKLTAKPSNVSQTGLTITSFMNVGFFLLGASL